MTDKDVALIKELAENVEFQKELAQVKARAVLSAIGADDRPIRWTYSPGRLVRNLRAILSGLQRITCENVAVIDDLASVALQNARAWEAIAGLQGSPDASRTALVNAAAAYELAGYQANAICLSRKYSRIAGSSSLPLFTLVSLFLQRLYLQSAATAEDVEKQLFQVDIDLDSPVDEDPLLFLTAQGLSSRAIRAASRYFLSGEREEIKNADELLHEALAAFDSLGLIPFSNLMRTLKALLPQMTDKSTWTKLAGEDANPRWIRYLKLLARGTGSNVLTSTSVSEVWPSQDAALANGLLADQASKVIRMPTSAGKTRIAELAIVHTLTNDSTAQCIYIAPYRALASELEQDFLNVLPDLGFQVVTLTGSYESDELERLLAAGANVLIVTPEKLDLFARLNPESLRAVRLVILDEVHLVHELERGVKFELLLGRLRRMTPGCKFLLLSAVVPKETLEDFSRWFNSGEKDILSSDWRPSVQRISQLHWKSGKGQLRFSILDSADSLHEFVPGILAEEQFTWINPATGRANTARFPTTKSEIAAELALKFAELGPVLIFAPQTNFVKAVATALRRRLEFLQHNIFDEDLPSYLKTADSTAAAISVEWLGADHWVTDSLLHGIAVHYGKMPDSVRGAVESDFRANKYRIIVSTSTLAQGVNLPIRTVIMHSTYRRIDDNSVRIPSREYWNIAGRAGRAGRETEGTVVHIVTSPKDEADYKYFLSKRNDLEPVQSALYQLLTQLVTDQLSEEALSEQLDSEILALIVEGGLSEGSKNEIEALLQHSLVGVQAQRHQRDLSPMAKVFTSAVSRIKETVPEREQQELYSGTGLSSKSCEAIRQQILERADNLRKLLTETTSEHLSELCALFLSICEEVSEVQTEFPMDKLPIFISWLNGAAITDLTKEFGGLDLGTEDFAQFLEEFFCYKLPWGISAIIRIAKSELGLRSMSSMVHSFAAMTKYGVPVPEAAWAMSAGVPIRKTALEIAARFRSSMIIASQDNFVTWLGTLEPEELSAEYGIVGDTLVAVSKSIAKGKNPLLQNYPYRYPLLSRVMGISYGDARRTTFLEVEEGDILGFQREYGNATDRNAIIVTYSGRELGYMDRLSAQAIAPEIDSGAQFEIKVKQKVDPFQLFVEVQPLEDRTEIR